MIDDWVKKHRFANSCLPHPDSPAGRDFDWQSLGMPHPGSPAGQGFDWSSVGLPFADSPAGMKYFGTGIGPTAGAIAAATAAAAGAGPVATPPPPSAASQTDPDIEALDLSEVAKKAAYELKKKIQRAQN